MAEINDLDIVDASNTGRFPENQAPSTVNNGARALEGLLARWHEDTNGSVATTGSANAYVLAAKQTLSAYYDGQTFAFDANFANTGSATLNVDAIGAKTIKYLGTALASGAIVIGQKVWVVYDGTDFQMISPSLVATLTGLTMDTLAVDTISEKTAANGVAIDSVTLKDGGVTATAASVLTSATFSGDIVVNAQAGSAVQTLTSATSVSWAITRNVAELTLDHDATLANPTGMVDGSTYVVRIIQGSTGGTLAYGSAYRFPGGTAPTLSTATSAVDIMSCVSDGTNLDCVMSLEFS